jgi:hypothetical protein
MNTLVTVITQCNQVGRAIISQLAPQLNVVYLQVSPGSARLAAPPVSLQHMATQQFVCLWI